MTFVPTFDSGGSHRPRLPRELDAVEVRVLGSLMEKQLSTPEYYPLTLNALVAACNQKSNREPVLDLSEQEVERALNRLQDERLTVRILGGRADRFDHRLDIVWHLSHPEKALLTLLFLRGPQTPGEMRGRSERLHTFDTVQMAEETLRDMAAHSEPLVRELPRRAGQKEQRWTHLVSGFDAAAFEASQSAAPAPSTPAGEPLSARVQRLEEQVAQLTAAFNELRAKLGE